MLGLGDRVPPQGPDVSVYVLGKIAFEGEA
jgi:hypothetical protein